MNNKKHRAYCGLCDIPVDDWEEHKESEEHLNNLLNPRKIIEVADEHIKQMRDAGFRGPCYPYGISFGKR